jgi:hypothetical protein
VLGRLRPEWRSDRPLGWNSSRCAAGNSQDGFARIWSSSNQMLSASSMTVLLPSTNATRATAS